MNKPIKVTEASAKENFGLGKEEVIDGIKKGLFKGYELNGWYYIEVEEKNDIEVVKEVGNTYQKLLKMKTIIDDLIEEFNDMENELAILRSQSNTKSESDKSDT